MTETPHPARVSREEPEGLSEARRAEFPEGDERDTGAGKSREESDPIYGQLTVTTTADDVPEHPDAFVAFTV